MPIGMIGKLESESVVVSATSGVWTGVVSVLIGGSGSPSCAMAIPGRIMSAIVDASRQVRTAVVERIRFVIWVMYRYGPHPSARRTDRVC